jgi:twinkle protein
MQKLSADFAGYLSKHALQQSTKVKSAGNWIQEVLLDEGGVKGDSLPWECTTPDIGLDSGVLSIWGGWSGHGKSELLGQVILKLMGQHRCAIASLEMKPYETINRMIKQTSGTVKPTDDYKLSWMDWANSRLFIYDAVDRVTPEAMMGMALYCKNELDVRHIVIDSLTKCGISKDDLSRQATFADSLQNICKNIDVSVHLVTHLRKPGNGESNSEPGKDDVRGAGEVTDLADNVFMVYRNKFKSMLIADGIDTFTDKKTGEDRNVSDMWDTKLKLVKNRQTGAEMDYKLWRNPAGQYSEARGVRWNHPDLERIERNVKKYMDSK